MKQIKRLLAAILTAALAVSLTAAPIYAVPSSFRDVTDSATALNADILRLMGVVDGVGDNCFNPGGELTRAEFCTMVVKFMQKGDDVSLHATRTIFSDVTSRHWALPYVNLAATLTVADGEEAKVALISGVGDGRFEPDAKITLGQAATILIRVLGYSSAQAGAVWPQSYMNLAASIGLTDDVSAGAYDNITRAQAAQLFVNALSCKTGGGETYCTSLGQAKEDVVLLTVGVDSEDNSSTGEAIRTSDGTYLPRAEGVKPQALQARRGTLILSEKNEIVTFVPDDSTSVTISLSGDAQPTYVHGTDGTQYTIPSTTPVYTADKTDGDTYINTYNTLRSGSQVTMFSQRGKIVAVYASGAAASSSDAVIVTGTATAAMFHQLTGGSSNFNVQKGRQTVRLSDIRPNDVVTYDSLTNTLIVSDLRLSCIFEDAAPNSRAPETITVLGYKFPVLDSAWDSIQRFSLGSQVTLLLTTDGKVAGMTEVASGTRASAVGLVSGDNVELFLPNGSSVTLSGKISNADRLADQLVTFYSSTQGKINATRLSSKEVSGDFDVTNMKLGDSTVLAAVQVYEQVASGATVRLDLSHLDMDRIPSDKISACHTNSAGMVDYIVLKDVTGDAYQYGMMTFQSNQTSPGDGETTDKTAKIWSLLRHGQAVEFSAQSGYGGRRGDIVGVDVGKDRSGNYTIRSIVQLQEIPDVSPADFFTSQGVEYVNAGGRTYRIAQDVECFRVPAAGGDRYRADNWFSQETGSERLNACKAYSNNLTLYVDGIGEKVRIIAAN